MIYKAWIMKHHDAWTWCFVSAPTRYILSVKVVMMTTANVEIGNTLQEVTNPMERTQNIAHLEKPTLLNSSGEITNHVLKLDQIILHSIFRRPTRFDTVW